MSKSRYLLLILLFSWIVFANAQESMVPNISYPYLEKLITAAKTNYPRVKTFDNKINIAGYSVDKAMLDWLNIFTFSYVYNPGNTPTVTAANTVSTANSYQIAATTSVGAILQKPAAVKSAKQELEMARLNKDEYFLNLEAIVKQRYFAYIRALTVLTWSTKTLEDAESTVKQIKFKFEKNEESFDNYNKALTSYNSAVQQKIESESAYLISRSALEEMIGSKLDDLK